MKTGTWPGKAVARYQIAVVRGSVLSPPPAPRSPSVLIYNSYPPYITCLLSSFLNIRNNVKSCW